MIFRPFHYFDTGCAVYVFGCGSLGLGAVVDPQERDVDAYVAFAPATPLLSLDRDAFVRALVDVPAKPAEMGALVRANRGLAAP